MHERSLTDEHRAKIRSSAISSEQVAQLVAAGWHTDDKGQLVIPYRSPDGSPQTMADGSPWIRFRLPQAKINANPKGPKYLSLKGAGCRLYHPALSPDHQKRLDDRDLPLRITEGELKAESCAVHDRKRVTIAIGGVDSWKDKRSGESQPLPEFDQIPLKGREVRLCFDSDLQKKSVRSALGSLAIWLARSEQDGGKGAIVYLERLPNAPERDGCGEIVRLGADDLIHNYGPRGFLRICDIADKCVAWAEDEETKKLKPYLRIPYDPEPDKAEATFIRAEYLTALLGKTWRSDSERPDGWQQWTGTHWERIDGNDPVNAAVERFLDCQGWRIARAKANVTGLVAAFRRQIEPTVDPTAAAGLLPFRNGCLRLSDQIFIPHRPENGNTWSLPYDYDKAATCPGIEKFLVDRLGDAASVAVFRAFARALLHCDRIKCFLEITGPSNTGKTVIANILQALVGTGNTTACTLQRIEDRSQRFETLKLRNKRLAVFSECQDYSGQLQLLKQATGGDPIQAEVKNGRHLEFFYFGGVVLVGNGPIRASDPSGAVINRRRSLHVDKVVQSADERELLDSGIGGGWRGELVPELPGLVNWCLAMPAAEARRALARDVQSPARAVSELRTLLETDHLAEWADLNLVWNGNPKTYLRVGVATGDPEEFAYASYVNYMAEQGLSSRALSVKVFKKKLVDLLRDTAGLPLPAGNVRSGDYTMRLKGSIVPCLRFRDASDDPEGDGRPATPGVVTQGFMRRAEPQQVMDVIDQEWERDGKIPAGNAWNGWNGSVLLSSNATQEQLDERHRGGCDLQLVTPMASIPQTVSRHSEPLSAPLPSVPQVPLGAGYQAIKVDGRSGWQRPDTPLPKAKNAQVPVVDPQGVTRSVERGRIELCAAPENHLLPSNGVHVA
jgi:phage/plasmid-associated DNA primase